MLKVALIGAGSAVFAQRAITDILAIDGLDAGTFALVDLDSERLELAHEVAEQTIRSAGKAWTVQATTGRRSMLPGCDYVINMIEVDGLANVHSDYAIPLKYGVDQCIADTIGPGGIFKYLRTAPSWLAICRDIEELCPRAPVINYSNPMSALVLTALRATSLQVVGLCQSIVQTAYELADYMNVPYEQMRYRCAGINHLSWFVTLEMDGEDLYPRLRSAADNPAIYEQNPVRFDLMRAFGYFTTESSGHVSEYVPYFRKRRDLIDYYVRMQPDCRGGERASRWPANRVEHDERLRDYLEREKRGERAFYLERGLDAGSYIIEGHALNRPQVIYGNVGNSGLIDNLPRDGCVELACLVDGNGIHPLQFGRLPAQLAALDNVHMMIHDLLVQTLLNEEREAAVQALMLDPLTAAVCSLTEIRQLFDEMASTQQAYLPHFINPT
ncbi:MAG TPA: alpha-glucosidase/alpha-galactosidase [Ktedonobacteraceae bacterium]|nr:alpha-glucosidase/alpha-galactosidase [Ktedonobacteraceae bacterium]